MLSAAVLVLLFVAGGAASAPSVSLVVTRYRAEFGLLMATGYPRRYIRRLVSAMGTIAADNLKRAHALLESGRARGKIVLEGF